jgi:hypothetical protein
MRRAEVRRSSAAAAFQLEVAGDGAAGVPPWSRLAGAAWKSAGKINVAPCPPACSDCRTASRAAGAASAADSMRCTQPDTGRASDSMSEVSGASQSRCQLAWSPTTLTIGVRARRALCRLAMPLAKPGPRCSSVAAGRPVMRP